MGATGTVGILRALLTADAATYQANLKKSADATKAFGSSVAAAGSTAARVSPQLTRLEKSFQGDKLLYAANNLTKAITNIGGATKLTAAEQARANRTLTEAIDKYRVLGQEAPASMVALQKSLQPIPQQLTAAQRAADLAKGSLGQLFASFSMASLATDGLRAVERQLSEWAATGTKLPAMEQAFGRLATSVRADSGDLLDSLRTATRGLVSNYDMMASANKAMLLGLPVTAESMEELAGAATALGRAMGQDATKSLDDLITALGRSSPMILDNLGLTVKVEEANEAYADALGKSADNLTEAEKKMAFYNAAMEAARKKTKELGDQTLTVTELMSRAWTSVGNVVSSFIGTLNKVGGALLTAAPGAGRAGEARVGGATGLNVGQQQAAALKAAAEELDRMMAKGGTMDVLAQGLSKAVPGQIQAIALTEDHIQARQREGEQLLKNIKINEEAKKKQEALNQVFIEASAHGQDLIYMWSRIPAPVLAASNAFAQSAESLFALFSAFDVPNPQGLQTFIDSQADAMARLNQQLLTTPEQHRLGTALAGLKEFGVRTREQQRLFVAETRQWWDAIVKTYGEGSREATEVLAKMTDEQIAIISRLPNYWQNVIVPTIGEALSSISQSFTQTFGRMLLRLEGWKDGFIAIWTSIKQAVAKILADILQNFIEGFLKKLLAQMASQRVANAVGGLFGGGGGGGGGLTQGVGLLGGLFSGGGAGVVADVAPNIATTAGLANAASIGGGAAGTAGGAGAAGTAAGAGGLGPAFGALASNPITWIAAAGILLAWGIGKKGWFRGGEEALHVSPARDRFLARFGPPGTGEGSGFQTLAALLTSLTGEGGGGRLFRALTSADTAKEFNSAVTNITTLLQRRGVPLPVDPNAPRQRRPTFHDGGLITGGASEVLVRALAGEGVLSHRGLRTIGGPSALNAANAGNPLPALAGSLAHAGAGGAMALPASLTGTTAFGAAAPPSVHLNMTIQAWDRADLNDAFRDEIIPRLRDALQFNQQGLLTTMKSSLGR